MPEGVNPYGQEVYEQARKNFAQLQKDGELVRESAPQIYLYRQIMDGHAQTGITAVCHADDYAAGLIKKHEKTRPDKEDDRVRLNTTLSAHIEPVFLAFESTAEIDALMKAAAETAPLFDFTAPDGVQHTLWRMPDAAAVTAAFAAVPHSYIADGHHRSAGAARVGWARREANPQHTGEEDYNWFPAVMFPQDQLQILAYNRLVTDLNGLHPEEFLVRVGHACRLSPSAPAVPARPRASLDVSRRALARAGIRHLRPTPIRSRASMSACCRTTSSPRSSASTIRAPASASILSAASAARIICGNKWMPNAQPSPSPCIRSPCGN